MRIGTNGPVVTFPASGAQTFFIAPPTDDEEWELLYIMAQDSAAIDAADIVIFILEDTITGAPVLLQESTVATGNTNSVTGNVAIFPNRSTVTPFRQVLTSIGSTGFIVKRKGATPWQRMKVIYAPTGTVGTRSFFMSYVYFRRRLK
jgi:hypothetical protein